MGFLDKFKKKDDFGDSLNEPIDGGWGNDSALGNNALGAQPAIPGGDPFASDSSPTPGSNPMPQDLGSQDSMMQQGMGGSDFHSDPSMGGGEFKSDVMGLPEQSYHESPNTSASSLNLNTNYPSASSQQSKGQQSYQGQQNSQGSPQNPGLQQEQYGSNEAQSQTHQGINKQDVELILKKLDLIKSTLLHLDSRISNIEHKMYEEKKW